MAAGALQTQLHNAVFGNVDQLHVAAIRLQIRANDLQYFQNLVFINRHGGHGLFLYIEKVKLHTKLTSRKTFRTRRNSTHWDS